MPAPDRNDPDVAPARARTRSRWRLGTPVVAVVSGALLAVSAANSQGTDLRPGRYTSLASLTEAESRSYQRLLARDTALEDEVDRLARSVDDRQVRRVTRRAARLRGPAGLEAVSGPGLRIVMSDAPQDVLEAAVGRADDPADPTLTRPLVVHQQDLQAVVNALWAGGATAVTLQGQRIVTTTGIRCSGSAVRLQGLPYPEPYTIEAVGDPERLVAALDADPWVGGFRADAVDPDVSVGWELDEEADVDAPAYDGLLDIQHARPRSPR